MIFREVEDADLVARARSGNVDAYNVLISRWERRVFHYLLKLVGDREDAMDLAQEVFLKAWQALGKLEDAGRFSPWLFRIAHNEAHSLLRRARPQEEMTERNDTRTSAPVQSSVETCEVPDADSLRP